MSKNFTKGFTLIEILVVIAILSILTSIVLTVLISTRDRAKGAAVMTSMRALANQAELLIDSEGRYPANLCVQPTNPVYFRAGITYGNFDLGPLHKESGAIRKYLMTQGWSLWQVYCTVDTFSDKPSAWAGFAMVDPGQVYFCVDSSGFRGANYIAGNGGKCIPF